MNLQALLHFEPEHLAAPAPWAGHLPFAHWLIGQLQPRTFVELGVYNGISYLGFCQAIVEHASGTRAWGIDTWQGDPHAGHYGEDIFAALQSRHTPRYSHFSTLVRSTFDEALQSFEDQSIDLLHIDGLHTYEAVRHDFETWKPKLSDRSVVLFHDTAVLRDDFGVHRLWDELRQHYPSIHFEHSHGLGVLFTGQHLPQALRRFGEPDHHDELRNTFARLGERFELRASTLLLTHQINDLQQQLTRETTAGQTRHDWIVQQDRLLQDLQTTHEQRSSELVQVQTQLDIAHSQIRKLQTESNNTQMQLRQVQEAAAHNSQVLQQLQQSRSWRLTAPLRHASALVRRARQLQRHALNALGYVRRGDLHGLRQRIGSLLHERRMQSVQLKLGTDSNAAYAILTPPHTLFLARLISRRLEHHGKRVQILTAEPERFGHDLYIVLCPQAFKRLPPGEKRLIFQLEQSVSSRWFTADYLDVLNNSLAMFDYNLDNIRFLAERDIKFPHVYYLPIGSFDQRAMRQDPEPGHDLLFYGDSLSSPRRQRLLQKLQQHFRVKVINNLFGEQMQAEIARARLVINLHYYDNALLETPRLMECLSLGVPVVSESASNQHEYPHLGQAVRFFEEGNPDDMLRVVRETLDSPPTEAEMAQAIGLAETQFNFFLDRFLLASDMIDSGQARQLQLPLPADARQFCLSLPETPARRDLFLPTRPRHCHIFDGLRKSPGWVGCGLSYLALASHALRHQLPDITVMEDDVILPAHFEHEMAIVQRYLHQQTVQWDIFSGLIASVHSDTRVLHVEQFEERTFVTIDKMTSTVFNIYSHGFLQMLHHWNPDDRDASRNTIDRYIENSSQLRVVVQLPFLTGHREEVDSTLWGFQNTQYVDWIDTSQKTLQAMADQWLADHGMANTH